MINAFPRPAAHLAVRSGFVLLLLAVLPGAIHAAKPAPAPPAITGPGHFFTIDLDPRYQFVGTGALTPEAAEHANCYRFSYTADGKPAEIEYRRAGTAMSDPWLGVARIDFEYQPGVERRWFRDASGKPMKDLDGISGEELTLNAAGYPTVVTNLDETGAHIRDGSGVIQYVRTLDAHNRIISSRRMGLFGGAITDASGYFERRWTYDELGHTVELANYDEHGNLLNDDNGVALIRTSYTIYPDATQVIESYFDASSLATEEKRTGVHQRQRTFDTRGFLVDECYFDATGAPTTEQDDRVHERKFTFDDFGNLVVEEFFDVNGHPVDERGPDIAKIVYKFNDRNRVFKISYFGDDGTPQINPQVGAAMIREEYDSQGNIDRSLYLDGQGHPSQHARYLAPAIRIKVTGDTTTVYLRNEQDQPAKNPVNGYSTFSYKTATDHPLTPTNKFYDLSGRPMSNVRVFIINPHLHALREKSARAMKWSARLGAAAAGLGSLLACFLALKKSAYTKRRKVYIPTPLERFLGWFSVFAILEGSVRFFMTIYWAAVDYLNGRMGYGFNVLETIFVLFFLYRLYRMTVTMRVLNIEREELHRLLRDFFAKAQLKAQWVESHRRYVTPPLDVRVRYFQQKFHAYLAFARRGAKGDELATDLAAYLRAQTGGMIAPERTKLIAAYYPCVALGYLLLAGTAFYTLYQLLKGA
jgi:hypothetical protein